MLFVTWTLLKLRCLSLVAQTRAQAAVALACAGDVPYAMEWEAQQQKLRPPVAPVLVSSWRCIPDLI